MPGRRLSRRGRVAAAALVAALSAAAALAGLPAAATAAGDPQTVPVLYEPAGTRPAEPARPVAPVEPEYESVIDDAELARRIQRHTWHPVPGKTLHEVAGVTAEWNQDGSVAGVTIGSKLGQRFLPAPVHGTVLVKTWTRSIPVSTGSQPVMFACPKSGPVNYQFYASYWESEWHRRNIIGRHCGYTETEAKAMYDRLSSGTTTMEVPVEWDEQFERDKKVVYFWNDRMLAWLLSTLPDNDAINARNAAKQKAHQAAVDAYQVELDAYQEALGDWREASAPWTEYDEAKAARTGMFVDCPAAGSCVIRNSVR
ncbi:MAG: hypothetical protein OXF61_06985 [Acidimicrobiaceae bacterium]|nr:hypothetical protein [Acidimicrobiaceae bacterium]MCY3948933.1 hypothetical protein [Acidimicrobiaceae bacterium]